MQTYTQKLKAKIQELGTGYTRERERERERGNYENIHISSWGKRMDSCVTI